MAVKTISLNAARQQLNDLLTTLETTGEPYLITHEQHPKAVLVRYEDYTALVEQQVEEQSHIVCRPDISGGEPLIRSTRISVRHILERRQAGQSVEDILAALPHLTPAQVYAALSYYYDHQSEIDQLIKESQPERVIAEQGLRAEQVADGVAVVRDQSGRW